MYEVIQAFPERFDDDHLYNVGDTYPREGFTPPEGRAEELLDGTNRAGQIYLEAMDDKKPPEETPVVPKEGPPKKKSKAKE